MNNISASDDVLPRLRSRIAMIEHRRPSSEILRATLDDGAIDDALGGGLSRGRLHEVFAIDAADTSSAAGFTAMLAIRLGGGILWLREDGAERRGGMLHAAGLLEIGVDPGRLILGSLHDPLAVLRAGADAARCAGVGVVVIELHRNPRSLDLTAGRRLSLATEETGVSALLLHIEGTPAPSAADTRWAVRSVASRPLAANAPGHPTLEIELLRQRGRPADHRWQVEWDRERTIFHVGDRACAAPSSLVVSLSGHRSPDPDAVVRLDRTG